MKRFYVICTVLIMVGYNAFLVAEGYIPIITDDVMVVAKVEKVTENITHNGKRYGIVISPYTERVWLDRNLGANRVCQSADDTECYGDYYQWGRNDDGHQYYNSQTTNILAQDVNNAGSKFITPYDTIEFDWAEIADSGGVLRRINWSKTDGSSICPVGFRVPTAEEIQKETIDQGVSNGQTAFLNFLKLPLSGYRNGHTGDLHSQGETSFLWTVSLYAFGSAEMIFGINAMMESQFRSFGLPVRCIQH